MEIGLVWSGGMWCGVECEMWNEVLRGLGGSGLALLGDGGALHNFPM